MADSPVVDEDPGPAEPGPPEPGPAEPDQLVGPDGEVASAGLHPTRPAGFEVHLDNFDGPFDLLLGLIAKHKMEITEISLSKVTDDFIGWIKAKGPQWDLEEASEFLLVAATLLDLKAARLLPAAEVEDDEDLALLEARDLLFARLLQYRAFKDVAATFAARITDEAKRFARTVPLEPQFTELLPELVFGISPEQFAQIAAKALTPKPVPTVALDHLHAPVVSVREQAALIVSMLRFQRSTTFRALTADAGSTVVVVARFLALLELYREGVVVFDQVSPLGELTVRWTGSDSGDVDLETDYDDRSGAEAPAETGEDGARE